MLSDEEKKAFQYYKECNEKDLENYEYLHEVSQKQAKYLEILLNLIEKQSKEIEELKEKNEYLPSWVSKKYVSKDKIKSKIEELDIEIQCCEYADDDLEEYKQDIEKEKARLLRDKAILQSLLKKE